MTIPIFVDGTIIAVQGGVRTTESKFLPSSIVDNLWECRSVQIGSVYRKSGRINPVWTTQYLPDYDKDLQDEKNVIKFKIPSVIQLDEFVLGFMFIGSIDCLTQYRLFRSRAEYATYSKHRIQKESTTPVVIYSDGMIEVHKMNVDKIDLRIDGVWQRPTDLPTYNYEFSAIPLDAENLSVVRQMVIQSLLSPEAKTAAKFKQDQKDITAQ